MSVYISNEPRKTNRVAVIDAIKAISAQLIVLHHFCLYGPMTDAAWGYAPSLFKWFANDARLAVQCFLVMAGFLAAGAMLPAGGKPWSPPPMSRIPAIAFQRYMRLAKTYLVGLAAAIVCAAIARTLVDDPTTPAAPTWINLAANLAFAQDLLGVPALTAGAWYVAIDLQLYVILALICAASAFAASDARSRKIVAMSIACTLGLCSLLTFNRNAELEMWGIYFFGSYSLGMIAHWASRSEAARKWAWLSAMALVCALALTIQWRSRIAVSAMTALILALRGSHRSTNSSWLADATAFLSRISFPLFVLHYPTLMLVGSLVKVGWGDAQLPNAIGLGVAWVLSMVAANALSLWVEAPKKISIRRSDTQIVV
jgi:peptidoglycan/LPS O-acetylase OafA/YrhL